MRKVWIDGRGDDDGGPGERDAGGGSNKDKDEDALTFAKLSNTKIGEVPLVLASAAISSAYAGVSAVAAQTPAELAENLAKNAKNNESNVDDADGRFLRGREEKAQEGRRRKR